MNVKRIKSFRFFDALLCLAIILISFFLIFFGYFKDSGEIFTVSCNGENTVLQISTAKSYEFKSNGLNLKVICDGKNVWVENSDCSDKFCVHSGKISKEGQMIVCSPARFSVTVGKEDGSHDAVTG